MTERAQRIVLASRPFGEPTLDNFRLEELPIPNPNQARCCCTRGGFHSLSITHNFGSDSGSQRDVGQAR